MVVEMKVYLDLVFFINFMFDLLLLLTVGIECKSGRQRDLLRVRDGWAGQPRQR